ncbi:unnamed protein product [Bursaphelenchus okinawaensis]|uniref:Uncharacterized protein n=1 Tax=Bursaphelenchus okinawaensis TaxID=465554 RepID=A0A811KSF3_9BILA|nr:unnamed protein product [Bursaphelenchus okinawaensis]CAG9109779.1 unnamed protein product [Bursaphelenchus okinawaensis]
MRFRQFSSNFNQFLEFHFSRTAVPLNLGLFEPEITLEQSIRMAFRFKSQKDDQPEVSEPDLSDKTGNKPKHPIKVEKVKSPVIETIVGKDMPEKTPTGRSKGYVNPITDLKREAKRESRSKNAPKSSFAPDPSIPLVLDFDSLKNQDEGQGQGSPSNDKISKTKPEKRSPSRGKSFKKEFGRTDSSERVHEVMASASEVAKALGSYYSLPTPARSQVELREKLASRPSRSKSATSMSTSMPRQSRSEAYVAKCFAKKKAGRSAAKKSTKKPKMMTKKTKRSTKTSPPVPS